MTALASIVVPASVLTRNSGRSGRAERLEPLDHLAQMEFRPERMDLLHQIVDQLLAVDDRISRGCRRSAFPDRARRTGRRASTGCRSGGISCRAGRVRTPRRARPAPRRRSRRRWRWSRSSPHPCLAGVVTTRPSSSCAHLDLAGEPRVRPDLEGEVEHVLLHLRGLADRAPSSPPRHRHGRSRKRRRRRTPPRCREWNCAAPFPSPSSRPGRRPCALRLLRR